MENTAYTWVNGLPSEEISVFDRGLAFGDGLFETLRVTDGAIPLLELHLQRLLTGARTLGIVLDEAQVRSNIRLALQSTAGSDAVWRLKYIVTRGFSNSGYVAADSLEADHIVQLSPFYRDVAQLQQQGVAVRCCNWRLSQQPALAGIKSLNRLDQVMARREWQDQNIFEGLMADQQGRWIEGTMSNLFFVDQAGSLKTPSLTGAGVAGVMRRYVMETLCPQVDLTVEETELKSLDHCTELFVTNSLIGIVPVTELENRSLSIGPITRKLQQLQQGLFKVD